MQLHFEKKTYKITPAYFSPNRFYSSEDIVGSMPSYKKKTLRKYKNMKPKASCNYLHEIISCRCLLFELFIFP